jgi:hypothetical protein
MFCHLPLGLAAIEDINDDNSILSQISGGEKKTIF